MKIMCLDIAPHFSSGWLGRIHAMLCHLLATRGRECFEKGQILRPAGFHSAKLFQRGPARAVWKSLQFHLQSGRKGLFQSHGSTRKKSWLCMNDICRPMLKASHGLNELFLGMGIGPRQGRVRQFCLDVEVAPQVLKIWDPPWFIKLPHSTSYL